VQVLAILFGAAFTLAVSLSLGRLVLRDACKDEGARLVVGAAVLSCVVFALCAIGAAYWWVFLLLGGMTLPYGRGSDTHVLNSHAPDPRAPNPRAANPSRDRKGAFYIVLIAFSAYFIVYLTHSMAPEASADGACYHLGLVTHYLREHGFVRITDNMYAGMPGG